MGNNLHCLIVSDVLVNVSVDDGELIAIQPDATLITAADWDALCAEAGGEAQLIELLGIVKDDRNGNIQ